MRGYIIFILILTSLFASSQSQYITKLNQWTNRWDYVLNTDWLKIQPEFLPDTLYVSYECDPTLISGPKIAGDTIFIDTCFTSTGDSGLFYLSGDTIINKNHYKVYLDDSVYVWRDAIPFLETGDPLAGFLTLRKLPGTNVRQIAMSSVQNAIDTLTFYGIGYWDLVNGHLEPKDVDSAWVKIIRVDTLYSLTDSISVDSICYPDPPFQTKYVGDNNYDFYLDGTGYDISIGDTIKFHTYLESCPDDSAYSYCTVVDTTLTTDTYVDVTLVPFLPYQIDDPFGCGDVYTDKIWVFKYDSINKPLVVQDDLTVTGDDVKFTGIPDSTTDHIIYYNEADGGISYGEASSGDTSFWQRTGNYLYPKNLPDSVGIGTATPTERLDVQNGNINLDTSSATSGQITQNGETIFHTYHEKGDNNLFIGQGAGNFTADSSRNIGIGKDALSGLTTGYNNIAIGYSAGKTISNRVANVAIGVGSAENNTGAGGTFVGWNSGKDITGNYTVGIGYDALNGGTSAAATGSVGVGYKAGESVTGAEYNVFIGYESGDQVTTGDRNVFIGQGTGGNTVSGSKNVFVGDGAGSGNTASNNIAIGCDALGLNKANTGSTVIGYNAMYYADNRTSGRITYNTAIGFEAMKGSSTAANNTGQYNTAVGYQALDAMTSGEKNTVFGVGAGGTNTTGSRNVYLGYDVGNAASYATLSDKLVIENSNADSTGALIFGNFATDRLTFNADLVYGKTHWEDLTTSAAQAKIGANNKPVYDFDSLALKWDATDTTTNYTAHNFQLKHAYAPGTSIYPHVHYWQHSASDTCEWMILLYRWTDIGETRPAYTRIHTNNQTVKAYTSNTLHQIASFPAIVDGGAHTESSIFDCKLYVYSNGVLYTSQLDIHFEQNKPGTYNEYP